MIYTELNKCCLIVPALKLWMFAPFLANINNCVCQRNKPDTDQWTKVITSKHNQQIHP